MIKTHINSLVQDIEWIIVKANYVKKHYQDINHITSKLKDYINSLVLQETEAISQLIHQLQKYDIQALNTEQQENISRLQYLLYQANILYDALQKQFI